MFIIPKILSAIRQIVDVVERPVAPVSPLIIVYSPNKNETQQIYFVLSYMLLSLINSNHEFVV